MVVAFRAGQSVRLSGIPLARWLLALLLAALNAGNAGTIYAQARTAPVEHPSAYDLQADERLGGHTLARHVGRTDQELHERLRRDPQISAASTYTDVMTARRNRVPPYAMTADTSI